MDKTGKLLTREEAYTLFLEYNKTDSLIKHGLSVEAIMRHFAKKFDEDVEFWGVVGLLHDMDYEMYPDEHCIKVVEILKAKDVDDATIRGIISHCWGINGIDVKPEHIMEKTLYATDELAGLVTACAYMRPSKSVLDMEVKSVMKKFKTASFAAGVDRKIVQDGCDMLEMELSDVINEVILAMRGSCEEIGLKGNL